MRPRSSIGNLVEAVAPGAAGLQHVHMVQGSKYYGSTLGPYRTPARESDPRVWERLVKKHGLRATPWEDVATWSYGDFVFSPEYDIMSDTTKARQVEFHETLDTEGMFIDLFEYYRQERIIP